jgi:hypothetical protein
MVGPAVEFARCRSLEVMQASGFGDVGRKGLVVFKPATEPGR